LRPLGVSITARPGIAPLSGAGVISPFGQEVTLRSPARRRNRFVHQSPPARDSIVHQSQMGVDKPVDKSVPGPPPFGLHRGVWELGRIVVEPVVVRDGQLETIDWMPPARPFFERRWACPQGALGTRPLFDDASLAWYVA